MVRWDEIVPPDGSRKATPAQVGLHDRFAIYHFDQDDQVAELVIRLLLNEDKKYVDLGQNRALLFHKAHVPNTEDHLHFMVKGTKVAAINKDGTAHDKSHGYQMQKWAMDGMKKHYPGFKVPKDGLIEHLMGKPEKGVLNEGFTQQEILVSRAALLLAVTKVQEAYAPEGQ